MSRSAFLALVPCLVLLGAPGCAKIIGADFAEAELAPTSAVKPAQCISAPPPERPANMAPSQDTTDFTVVIRSIELGDDLTPEGTPPPIGYDLDGVCTGKSGPSSCKPWGEKVPEDGPDGRDNSINRLFDFQRAVFGDVILSSQKESEAVANGLAPPQAALRIRGFSALGTDDHVTVELFNVARLQGSDDDADGGSSVIPRFDRDDAWPVLDTSLVDALSTGDARESIYRDDDAFVVNGQLTARFSNVRLRLRDIFAQASDVVLTGQLKRQDDGQWHLAEGNFAARIDTNYLLRLIPLVTKRTNGVPLCTNDPANYAPVKGFICGSADLAADGDTDGKTPCSFTSLALGFETSPGSLGPTIPDIEDPPLCGEGTDPGKDSCDF